MLQDADADDDVDDDDVDDDDENGDVSMATLNICEDPDFVITKPLKRNKLASKSHMKFKVKSRLGANFPL